MPQIDNCSFFLGLRPLFVSLFLLFLSVIKCCNDVYIIKIRAEADFRPPFSCPGRSFPG